MTRTWSPGRAACLIACTSAPRSSNACALSPSGDSGSDGGRVMGKVVVDGDVVHRAAQLHAAFDVFELFQRGDRLRCRHADMTRSGNCRQRIHAIVFPGQRPMHGALRLAVEGDVETTIVVGLERPAFFSCLYAKILVLAPATTCDHALQSRLAAIDDKAANAGHGTHQMVELRLDGSQVRENV